MSEPKQPVKHQADPSGDPDELSQDPARLRWHRNASGLSQTQVAARTGYSKSHISKLEGGHDSASPGLLKLLADTYGCEITDLMPREINAELAYRIKQQKRRPRRKRSSTGRAETAESLDNLEMAS